MNQPLLADQRLRWLNNEAIRPYVFVRKENAIGEPGRAPVDWFSKEPILKDPQAMAEEDFTSQILNLENTVFGAELAMPRWVFYDCAVMPGFVAGFAIRKIHASPSVLRVTKPHSSSEWVPLSLFVIIPTMGKGEWVAHNLSSINSALASKERYYGLGFLSKAFGLWYANIDVCCGMTQWRGPALKLHSHYGDLEVMTAYTPSHTVAETLTYRLKVNPADWSRFFTHEPSKSFEKNFAPSGLKVDRSQAEGLKTLQREIEASRGQFYLSSDEISQVPNDAPLTLYRPL